MTARSREARRGAGGLPPAVMVPLGALAVLAACAAFAAGRGGAPAKAGTAAQPAATTAGHAVAHPASAAASASPAAVTGSSDRVAHVAKPLAVTVQAPAQVEQHIHYQYDVLGRRDPFAPLNDGFVPLDRGGDAPVDVGGLKVVGIVWGADQFALVEDARGNSLVLRKGDKVMDGYVDEMRRDAMVVKLTTDGQTQSVVIPLTRKGDRSNASR